MTNTKDTKDEKTTTIDEAILSCEKKVREYKKQSFLFLLLIMTLILAVITMTYSFIVSNKSTSTNEQLLKSAGEHNIKAHNLAVYYAELASKSLEQQNKLLALLTNVRKAKNSDTLWKFMDNHKKFTDMAYGQTNKVFKTADSLLYVTNYLQGDIKDANQKSIESNSNNIYLALYGLFVLVFSVTISLYRYCLKQISKIEHFYFGLLRIRIAGNNSKTGFDDYVKESLTKDAFSFETNSPLFTKSKPIESPIQGHPISDLSTTIINKLLETYELKPKK